MQVDPIAELKELVDNVQISEFPQGFKISSEISNFRFTYTSEDKAISGFLSLPKTFSKQLPVIIYNRGGSFNFGLVNDNFLHTFLSKLASWGYLVIGTQYPGNEQSEGVEEFGGISDIRSVLDLKNIIDQLSFADEQRIGMLGHSRGGMMTYLCLKQVGWIRTALTIGGLSNLESTVAFRPEMDSVYKDAFGSTESGKRNRSAINWVDELDKTVPLCIMHGASDARVLPRDSIELAQGLDEIQYKYALHIVEGGNHYLTNRPHVSDIIIKDWFVSNL